MHMMGLYKYPGIISLNNNQIQTKKEFLLSLALRQKLTPLLCLADPSALKNWFSSKSSAILLNKVLYLEEGSHTMLNWLI